MSMLAEDHLNKDTDAASESRTAGAPPKRTRQNDSKRRTVQVEYVAPRSQGDLASRSALHSEVRDRFIGNYGAVEGPAHNES